MALITNGLQLYYNSKQGVTSGAVQNISPNTSGQYNLTLTGSIPAQADGLLFSAGTSATGTLPIAMNGVRNFTIEAWIKPNSSDGYPTIYMGGPDGVGYEWYLYGNPIELEYYSPPDGYMNTPSTGIGLNTLFHIAVTFDAATGRGRCYINGVATSSYIPGSPLALAPPSATVQTFQLSVPDAPFLGHIAVFRIYDRVLTDAEIQLNNQVGTDVGISNDPGTDVTYPSAVRAIIRADRQTTHALRQQQYAMPTAIGTSKQSWYATRTATAAAKQTVYTSALDLHPTRQVAMIQRTATIATKQFWGVSYATSFGTRQAFLTQSQTSYDTRQTIFANTASSGSTRLTVYNDLLAAFLSRASVYLPIEANAPLKANVTVSRREECPAAQLLHQNRSAMGAIAVRTYRNATTATIQRHVLFGDLAVRFATTQAIANSGDTLVYKFATKQNFVNHVYQETYRMQQDWVIATQLTHTIGQNIYASTGELGYFLAAYYGTTQAGSATRQITSATTQLIVPSTQKWVIPIQASFPGEQRLYVAEQMETPTLLVIHQKMASPWATKQVLGDPDGRDAYSSFPAKVTLFAPINRAQKLRQIIRLDGAVMQPTQQRVWVTRSAAQNALQAIFGQGADELPVQLYVSVTEAQNWPVVTDWFAELVEENAIRLIMDTYTPVFEPQPLNAVVHAWMEGTEPVTPQWYIEPSVAYDVQVRVRRGRWFVTEPGQADKWQDREKPPALSWKDVY